MKNKIRVLHYIPGFDHGGIESRLLDWYRNMDRNKIQFDIVKLTQDNENKFLDEFKELGGKVYTLPKFSIKNFVEFQRDLNNLFKEGNYDIAHCHSAFTGYFFLKSAKKWNVPVRIMHSRTTRFNPESSFIAVREFLKKLTNKYATHYFACSKEAGAWQFGENEILKGRVKIINNGIECNRFVFDKKLRSKLREEFNLENCFVVGHVGRFASAKNHLFLIDIFYEIYKYNENARLMLIGSGPTEKEIINKLQELHLSDKVILLGTKNDVENYYQCMDVFVFPSQYEGFGTVAVEAQASGLKCFVSDGVPESVKVTDLVERLSLSLDPIYWAKEICKYSNGYVRRDTREEIKKSGFDIYDISGYLESFYKRESKK